MKGILFKPWKIQFIAEHPDMEIQTRRLGGLKEINREPDKWILVRRDQMIGIPANIFIFHNKEDREVDGESIQRFIKPRYQQGETVYLKEAIRRFNQEWASYKLDCAPVMFLQSANRFHWRWEKDYLSPLHLPQEAARHFVTITGVRAERGQEITEEDALAEGIIVMSGTWQSTKWNEKIGKLEAIGERHPYTARYHFEALWNSINPKYPWKSNPWVFAYTFERNVPERMAVAQKRQTGT